MLAADQEDVLVTSTDKFIAKVILGGVAIVVLIGYITAQQNHPNAIPLQAARDLIEPLAPRVNNGDIKVKVKKVIYRVPERSMQLRLELENRTDAALQIGELSVANVRFINSAVVPLIDEDSDELVVKDGLSLDDNAAIAAGEKKILTIEAKDAAWETEKLDGLIRDADSRMGGLLFLYGANNQRHIISLSASVIPQYVSK